MQEAILWCHNHCCHSVGGRVYHTPFEMTYEVEYDGYDNYAGNNLIPEEREEQYFHMTFTVERIIEGTALN